MRNLSTLNQLWDGADIQTERRSSESFTVRGARFSIGLQVQGPTLQEFCERSGELARGTGFFARCLISWPTSTQGQRMFTESEDNWPAIERYNKRIESILNQAPHMDGQGGLCPQILTFSPEAKKAWVAFHDAIENELGSGGEFFDLRDVASKIADNAARVSAIFHYIENGLDDAISVESFEGAARITMWHLYEAKRFFGELAVPKEMLNASKLDAWLLNYCKRNRVQVVSRRDVQQRVSPVNLRKKQALDEALQELIDLGRIRSVKHGTKKDIHINPDLLKDGEL